MDLYGLKLGGLLLVVGVVGGGWCGCDVFGLDAGKVSAEVLQESSLYDRL